MFSSSRAISSAAVGKDPVMRRLYMPIVLRWYDDWIRRYVYKVRPSTSGGYGAESETRSCEALVWDNH